MGALGYVRLHHRIRGDGAAYYLADAIPRRRYSLIHFNDARAKDFGKSER